MNELERKFFLCELKLMDVEDRIKQERILAKWQILVDLYVDKIITIEQLQTSVKSYCK